MSLSFRPRSHAERDQIVSAIVAYLARPDADPSLVAAESSVFTAVRAEYQTARAAYQAAVGAAETASDAADVADEAFDRSFRLFAGAVRDEAGRLSPRTLADRMEGVLPGELVSRPYREEVRRTRDLLSRIGAGDGLGVDTDLRSALSDSLDALEAATDTLEEANRASRAAGAALTESVAAFDLYYGKLVRRWQGLSEEGVTEAILPRFVRAERKGGETASATPE